METIIGFTGRSVRWLLAYLLRRVKDVAKVILGTMNNARKLVSIVEKIPYDAELCSGRYVVNANVNAGSFEYAGI